MKLNLFSNRALAWAFLYIAVALGQVAGQTKPAPATTNESGTVRVVVAYDSLTGNTEKMAEGVVEGVKRQPGVAVSFEKVEEVTKQDLESADGIILGCLTYHGTLPGKMKAVIDDWSWKMKVDFTDKVGGAFSTGGGQVGGKDDVHA